MEEMSIGEFARRSRLSPKALRLYDDLDLLSPARVDESTGYRWYDAGQLDRARLIAMFGQLDVPLATTKQLLDVDRESAAQRVAALWRDAEDQHAARRDLAALLIDRLTGRKTVMYDVATRDMPQRSLLCLKRNVDEAEAWVLGKEFIGIVRDPRLPRIGGREGAVFSIYWGEVSADSDGPVEWCKTRLRRGRPVTRRTVPRAHPPRRARTSRGLRRGRHRPGQPGAVAARRPGASPLGRGSGDRSGPAGAQAGGSRRTDHLPRDRGAG